MAKKKLKKKSSGRKKSASAKAAKPSARRAKPSVRRTKPPGDAGPDESSETLRASAKTFAFRLLR